MFTGERLLFINFQKNLANIFLFHFVIEVLFILLTSERKIIRKFSHPDSFLKTLFLAQWESFPAAPTSPGWNGDAYSRVTHRRGIPRVSSPAYPTSGDCGSNPRVYWKPVPTSAVRRYHAM